MTLIVAVLAAGAADGVTDTAEKAVQDAYESLKRVRHAQDLDGWRTPLEEAMREGRVADDVAVLAAAERLMKLVQESDRVWYAVRVAGGKGVHIGDAVIQTNTFTTASPRSHGSN